MANIKSAKKRVLVSEANYQRNKSYRSALKTALKKADAAIEAKSADAVETVKVAVKKLDQAQAKGIMHKNAVARKKSQLANRLNKAN
jgi:small subunit ribosomal protein S20